MLNIDKLDVLRSLLKDSFPLPGTGSTAQRHRRLFDIGRAIYLWPDWPRSPLGCSGHSC